MVYYSKYGLYSVEVENLRLVMMDGNKRKHLIELVLNDGTTLFWEYGSKAKRDKELRELKLLRNNLLQKEET